MDAKTIEIFLPNGDANKVSIARVTTESINIVSLSKNQIEFNKDRIGFNGCYILSGVDEYGQNKVYIGQSDNVFKRLKEHIIKKEFWTTVYVIQNTSGSFDMAHLIRLEQLMIYEAISAKRVLVENKNNGTSSNIPEAKGAECLTFLNTIKTLINALGFKVFTPEVTKEEKEELVKFYYSAKNNEWDAIGIYDGEKFTVLEGSIVRIEPTKHVLGKPLIRFKDKLLDEGVIVEKHGKHIFSKDYSFSSPSYAADIVSLRSNNGWNLWKTQDGLMLKDVHKRQ